MQRSLHRLCFALFLCSFHLMGAPKKESKILSPKEISKKPTSLTQIKKWRDLPGGNYVVGYGDHPADPTQEVALAVYDKTFRSLLSNEFLKKSWLFAFGFESRSLSNMARGLRHAHEETEEIKQETLDEFITELENTKTTIVLKKDFWKKKYWKWKPDRKPDLAGEPPAVIYLSDIDVAAMVNGSENFIKMKKKLPLLLSSELTEEDTEDMIQVLESSKLVRLESGEYQFDNGNIDLATPPVKIIDIMGKFSSYRWAVKYAVSALVLKSVTNSIPFYGPPQAATFIMERVFNLAEVCYLIRHGMAMGLVLSALEGNSNSPFYGQFSQQELEDAGSYLLLSRTLISSLIVNSRGHDKILYHYRATARKEKAESILALQKRGIEVFPIANTFYAIGKKKRATGEYTIKVYSLLKHKVFRANKPANVVDFSHTRAEYRKRNAMEGTLACLSWVATPVVNVGSLIKFIFKEGFVREIHRRQIQEAGFRSLLLNHPQDFFTALSEAGYSTPEEKQLYYVTALGIIEDREINQFDLKAKYHAHWRKKVENWIFKKDPSYQPIPSALPELLRREAFKTDSECIEEEAQQELLDLDEFLEKAS